MPFITPLRRQASARLDFHQVKNRLSPRYHTMHQATNYNWVAGHSRRKRFQRAILQDVLFVVLKHESRRADDQEPVQQ